jgi:hypothetical protein
MYPVQIGFEYFHIEEKGKNRIKPELNSLTGRLISSAYLSQRNNNSKLSVSELGPVI